MTSIPLKPEQWYWLRRDDGSIAAYRFHRLKAAPRDGAATCGEFFVGSMLQTFPLSRVIAAAEMPAGAPER